MNILKNYKYEYYSFDIFNTLLNRTISEAEVYEKTEKKLIKINKKFKGYAALRISSQKELQSQKDKVETTIYEIYNNIKGYSKADKKIALEKEIETELENLRPNLILKQFIENILARDKKVIIISDMYFDSKIIRQILKYFGIKYAKLYVSSDLQLRKHNGTIFKYVLNDLNISPKNIIHIGDNKVSDYIMPKLNGIKSYLWLNRDRDHSEKFLRLNSKEYDTLYNFLGQKKLTTFYQEIGYKYFGPFLYSLCNWIQKKKQEHKFDEICFLSRDGQIISKAFYEIYQEQHPYFLASRRTLTVPLLETVNNIEELMEIVPYIKRKEKLTSFLKKVGIENHNLEQKLIDNYGENIEREFLYSESGKAFFSEIKDEIISNAKEEKKAAIKYIEKYMKGTNIGLIDIGWYGTMQKSLEKICKMYNVDKQFYGLYVGLLEKKGNHNLKNASGFIYDYKEKKHYDSNLIYGFNGLIELMFTADHPSAKKYIIKNNNVDCILEKEIGEYSEFVKQVQIGALEFVKDFAKNKKNVNLDNKAYVALEDLLINPTTDECYLLESLKFYDAYFEDIIQYKGFKNLILKPKEEIRAFLNSNWKIGYIKEMFKINNPKTIYKIINKIK